MRKMLFPIMLLTTLVGCYKNEPGNFVYADTIEVDPIIIKLQTTQSGMCDYICCYTCIIKSTGIADSYWYGVSVDDYLTFPNVVKR